MKLNMDFSFLNVSNKNLEVMKCALRVESALCDHPDKSFIKMGKNQRLNPSTKEPRFYLLTSGKINIHRICDDVLVMEVSAPAVLDICRFVTGYCHHYFRGKQDFTLFSLGQAHAHLLFDQKSLWKDILFLQCDLTEQHYQREEMTAGHSHYDIVLEHLKYIWSLPTGDRERTSVYNFILSRNKISRSSIYNIICMMTREGLIKIIRGRLIYLDVCRCERSIFSGGILPVAPNEKHQPVSESIW